MPWRRQRILGGLSVKILYYTCSLFKALVPELVDTLDTFQSVLRALEGSIVLNRLAAILNDRRVYLAAYKVAFKLPCPVAPPRAPESGPPLKLSL